MKILVTGGLGYIGSHTVVELINNDFDVHIIDDLSNSNLIVLDNLKKLTGQNIKFDKISMDQKSELDEFFEKNNSFDGIIHFAAKKYVGESTKDPLLYYRNNLSSLINLLDSLRDKKLNNLIFSSSCTVYGNNNEAPFVETTRIAEVSSPYGNTKKIGEEIIKDAGEAYGIKSILLRYFNPIGAHPSSIIGEKPNGVPQNLIPYLTQTAIGKRKILSVFGGDYNTYDGTALRDYIDVMDLAEAHVKALKRLIKEENKDVTETFNLGTGIGVSVLDVIKAFEKATGKTLPYKIVDRRQGDVEAAYANTDKAKNILDWTAKTSLEQSLLFAWNWELKQIHSNFNNQKAA